MPLKVVVVRAGQGADPRHLAAGAAAVLVVGPDAAAVGVELSGLRDSGVRAGGFVGDVDVRSPEVAEMAAELFPGCEISVEAG